MEVPQWVKDRYGNVEIHRDERAPFKVVDLVEITDGDTNLGIYVSDARGDPIQNVAAVMWWPGAYDEGLYMGDEAGWLKAGQVAFTNEAGYVGWAMGGGSYYWPKDGQEGPQAVWLHGDGMSEMVSGLGMIGQTNHHHVNVHYCMQPSQPPPPQPPPPEPPAPPPEPPTPPPDEPAWCAKIMGILREILVELRRLAE